MTRIASLALCLLFAVPGCAEDVTTDHRSLETNAACSNANDRCYCITDADCPASMYCQIADSPPPPFQGLCLAGEQICHDNTPDNSTACCNANDQNCPPPPPSQPPCSNTDPNCAPPPPPPGCSNTDPNCAPPPPGCNSGNCN